ncbi:unnamed protein product, partial [Thelazia callipaeda]|uniref:Chitin-binding type-2 domain-containing protein n=1 Tax=Thelazia callipaeda TaxID=103827 RepID=A0A0N5CPU5_THECL
VPSGDKCDSVGDKIANNHDCTSYYECYYGKYELKLCPSGTFFDPKLKCCHRNYICPNRAYDLPTTPSFSCKYGELRADDTSCQNYYSCVGDDRHFERRVCPDGKIFDRRVNRCVYDTTEKGCQQSVDTQKSQNTAIGLACTESSGSSGYSADPTDCQQYYQCAQGRWVRMHCPGNLVWNPAISVCDWPKNTLLSCKLDSSFQ